MNDLEQIFRKADEDGVHLALSSESVAGARGDAVLFDAVQVPVVAMCLVACITGRRKETASALGARVGHTLMKAFPDFKRVGRYLQWSIRVRTVTADALAFLERSGLIEVTNDDHRKVSLTVRGREFARKVRMGDETSTLFSVLSVAATSTRNEDLRLL